MRRALCLVALIAGCGEARADEPWPNDTASFIEICHEADSAHPVRFAEHLYPGLRAGELARLVVTVTRPAMSSPMPGYAIKQTAAWVRDGAALAECGDDGTVVLFQF